MTTLTATVPLAPSRRRRGGRLPWIFISLALAIHLAVLLALILVIPRIQPEEGGSPQGVEMVFEQPTEQPTPPGVPNLPNPGVLPAPSAPPVPTAPPTLATPAPPTPPPAPQQTPSVNLTAPPPVPEQAVPLPPAVPPQPPEAQEVPIPPVPPAPQEALVRPPTPHQQEAKPRQQAARPRPAPAPREASLAHPMARSLSQSSTNVAASFFNPFSRPEAEQPPAPTEGEVGSAVRTAAGMLAPFAYFPQGDPGPDFRKSLMSWWLAHRYYPPQAAEAGEDGEVHISLIVDRLGRVRDVQLNEGSGSLWLDMAGVGTWRGAQLIPIPDSLGRDNIVVDLTLHYILVRH